VIMFRSKWLALLALGLSALGASTPALAQSGWQQQGSQSIGQICPMYVSSTQVETTDLNGQIQLTFRTGGDVRELQQRTALFAEALVTPNPAESEHRGPMGLMSKGPMAVCSEMMGLQQASIRGRPIVDNLRDGARIVFQAQDPETVPALRARVHLLAAQLVTGQCPQSAAGLLAPSESYDQQQQQQQYQQHGQWQEPEQP